MIGARGLAGTPTARVVAGSAAIALLLPPMAIAALLEVYGAVIGELTLTLPGGPKSLGWRWVFPLSGMISLFIYLTIAGISILVLRGASRSVRNWAAVALLPISLAVFYFVIVGLS